ncbi:MAG: NADP-dependent oxidoreductase [Bacteroidota bacterium]
MKAIILQKPGEVDQLSYADLERPDILKDEVLVEVKAIGINPVDYKVRANEDVLTMIYGEERPAILGWDIAGVVIAVGSGVTEFEVGERVFGMVNFPGAGKAYAQFVNAPAHQLSLIPPNISFEAAAATTLAALTALQVLRNNVKENDRILIHAGSGGVGHFAIQIAKTMGAYVITTGSGKNRDMVMSLGADEFIDYTTQAFQEVVKEVDFVFDMFNGEVLLHSIAVVKKRGKIISLPTPEFSEEIQRLAQEREVDLSFLMVQSNGEDMRKLASLLESGAIKPHISRIFLFDEMAEAHRQLESGRTVGKVVVTL